MILIQQQGKDLWLRLKGVELRGKGREGGLILTGKKMKPQQQTNNHSTKQTTNQKYQQ